MLLAQALGEYGGLAGISSTAMTFLEHTFDVVTDTVHQAGPTTWVAVGCGAVVLWFFLKR